MTTSDTVVLRDPKVPSLSLSVSTRLTRRGVPGRDEIVRKEERVTLDEKKVFKVGSIRFLTRVLYNFRSPYLSSSSS